MVLLLLGRLDPDGEAGEYLLRTLAVDLWGATGIYPSSSGCLTCT